MKKVLCLFWCCLCCCAQSVLAETTVYTDESVYINALQTLGYTPVHEGFESDTVWGTARTPTTATSITSHSITWTANNANGGVTTGSGPALTGNYGFFTLPHGDPINGINDGFIGTAASPIFGVGGWIETNTPFASIDLYLNGDRNNAVDFDMDVIIGTTSSFWSVIDTAGISSFEIYETEGEIGDQKFIFADDFTFAFAAVPEPSAMFLFAGIGIPYLVRLHRKRIG